MGVARPFVRLAIVTATKAASVSLVPFGALLLVASKREAASLRPIFLWASAGFVGAATLFRLCREFMVPDVPAPVTTREAGPRGVASQDEASSRVERLLMSFWEDN